MRVSKIRGGYVKKQRKKIRDKASPTPKPEKVEKPQPLPLPKGLPEALKAMAGLSISLKDVAKTHYTVSVDRKDDEWVLVVRGYEPYFDSYMGYGVIHKASTLVRNPFTRAR